MSHYPRPAELTLSVQREPVEGSCPSCGAADLARYPVHSEGGWFITTRCQACLHQVDRTRWNLHGHIAFLSDEIGR